MENIWNFFEELDEMVYVSDVETHQLVYMNHHLRTALGYEQHADYQGKMCYKVLQGMESPCPFCNNAQLEPGKFVSWVHKNPILGKRFLVKDSLVPSDGRQCRMEIAIDADSDVVCHTSYFYARSETILNECMQKMVANTEPEEAIQSMLAYVGQAFGGDRTYIFEIYPNQTTSNTYEWCAEGVRPQKNLLQNISLSAIDW